MFICKHIKDNFFINFINLVNKMKLGKRLSDKTKNNSLQRFILYFLVLAFVTSLISSIVLSILLVCTKRDLSLTVDGFTLASTGPIVLIDAFKKEGDVHILPYDDFNPMKERKGLRYIETLFLKSYKDRVKSWDTAKVVHHGSESWGKE